MISARGFKPTIADARFAKPLDRELILALSESHDILVTIEEGAVGGFGSHVMQLLSDEGRFDQGLKFRSMVLPDIFVDQASPEEMYKMAGLDAESIKNKLLHLIGLTELRTKA